MTPWARHVLKARPLLASIVCLWGCVTDTWRLRDLTFASAKVIDQRDMPPRDWTWSGPIPPGKLLVVAFRSAHGNDLYPYADKSHYTMVAEVSVCSHGGFDEKKLLKGDPSIYGDRGRVEQDNPVMTDAPQSRTFHTYVDMSGDSTCAFDGCSPFPYNLMKTPEDICLYLHGGAIKLLFPRFQSNLIRVPGSALAAAIGNARPHAE